MGTGDCLGHNGLGYAVILFFCFFLDWYRKAHPTIIIVTSGLMILGCLERLTEHKLKGVSPYVAFLGDFCFSFYLGFVLTSIRDQL